MARLLSSSLVILSFLALSLAPLAADTLSVDTGLDGQDVQAGWVGISGPTSVSPPDTVSGVFSSTMGSSGSVTVQIRTVQGFRDRGNVTHQIGDVVEDMVFNNSQLGMGLLGLKPGTYYFRSYHHDSVDQGPIDVKMTDAAVSSKVMYENVPQSFTPSSGPVQARAIPLIVQVGASGEASFSWTKKGNDTDNAVLSGFQVTDTPAADLKVDFGTTTSPILAGWERFGEADGAKLAENWYFTEIGNQGSVRVAVSTEGTLGFRNRSGVSTPDGPMLRDFVFYRGEGDLTLNSLLPGRYAVTTYHFDSDNPTTWKPISMSVSDALGSGRALPDVQPNGGTSPTTVATASFEVYSDGVSPVVIHAASVSPSIALYSGLQVIPLDTLRVDFGGDSSGNDVQHGFAPFNRPLNSNTSGLQSETYATGLGAAGQVTVSLQAADNVLTWRDRGDVYNPDLGDVAEDFVFDDRWISMTLTDLRQGQYLMSAYFHDKGFNHGSVDVLVSDAAGVDRLVALGVVMPDDDSTPGTASFEFFSDGSNPVAFRFREHDSDSFVMLTGFAVSEIVPEPASLTLAALALSGLGGYVRRRRR